MKRLKISMIAVIAIVMGIAASAFNVRDAKLADGWFTISSGNPNLAASYMYYGTSSPCFGSTALCAIEGTRNPSNLNQPLQTSVDTDKTASGNFAHPAAGKVTFTP
ncbi:MAG: hypothetical protein M3Z26_06685 [Bacteroidota bacterium]|nr:hypothetical protein [Bacteroidota bacterium]